MEQSDLLIVGGGIFGTSTAYHYARSRPSPVSVTVVDRTAFPPQHAASTDINKIIRADYGEGFYMDLAYEAMDAWTTWPQIKKFYHRTGWVALTETGDDLAQRIRQNFRERGHDPTKDLSLEQVKEGFGGIFKQSDFGGCDGAYWNPEAGWCDAGMATAALMQDAVDHGVKYRTGTVEQILLDKGEVMGVKLDDGSVLTADKVLLCAGAWTSSLMNPIEDELELPHAERVERQVTASAVCVAHYKMSDEQMEQLKEMPVTIFAEWGDAQPPPHSKLLKFTNSGSFVNTVKTAGGHEISVPPARDQGNVSQRLKAETRDKMPERLMRHLIAGKDEAYWRLCWDAISPSQDHLITRHPRLKKLYFACGGSFHSYKFLPTIGRYVMNVLDGVSNGEEKDRRWAWKSGERGGRGAHEKAYPTRELREVEEEEQEEKAQL